MDIKVKSIHVTAGATCVNDHISDKFAKLLREEIDREIVEGAVSSILRKTLSSQGWVSAPFTIDQFMWPLPHRLDDVMEWVHKNSQGGYRVVGKEFWFEQEQDLTTFVLRWS